MCSLVLGFLFFSTTSISEATESKTLGSSSPVIQDFYVNSTCAGNISQFAFNLTDAIALQDSTFACNATSPPIFTNQSMSLSGTQTWANFTVTLPNYNCTVTFDFWVKDTSGLWANTGNRTVRVYTTGVSAYFNYLAQAITTVENTNTWSQVDPYYAYILQNNLTSLQITIDNCAAAHDWQNVLLYSAECNKLWPNNIPSDVKTDINYALGNYTMIGNSIVGELPHDSGGNYFLVFDRFAFYGYYYANQSWALSYNSSITSKWNVTSAYSFFDTAVNYSVNNAGIGDQPYGLPIYIYPNETGQTFDNRFYDECAETVSCYLLFAELLNVSDALNKAVYWWNYLVSLHWTFPPGFFGYAGESGYECEAPFFLKIISLLKYYVPTLANWNYVLEDTGNRFLSSAWNSAQWTSDSQGDSVYVVVHAGYGRNPQRRLENTLGAWQSLLGVYTQLNSTYQSNMVGMLQGTTNLPPAWALMLLQYNGYGLYNTTSHMFSQSDVLGNPGSGDDANYTAQAEILMFMEGIVPGSTSLAFPLEELNYEYTQDLDPALLTFNSTTRTITIPVVSAGTLTFQYGTSPITYYFAKEGVWSISFSGSWNMITSLSYVSSLPTNLMYFVFPSVPEFPSLMILLLFFLTMLVAALRLKKKRSQPSRRLYFCDGSHIDRTSQH